jgi:hypothetical protein
MLWQCVRGPSLSAPWHHRAVRLLALTLVAVGLMLAFGWGTAKSDDRAWVPVGVSYYGPASAWDCGHLDASGNCVGYFYHYTAFYWHCDWTAWDDSWGLFLPSTRGVAHQWLPLGSWIELRTPRGDTLVLPVIDRGPYAPWGDRGGFDLAWSLRSELKGAQTGFAYRTRPDISRHCPRHGYWGAREWPPTTATINEPRLVIPLWADLDF